MNWENCRQAVGNACVAHNDAARSTEQSIILAAVRARRGLSALLRQLVEIDDADELENLLGIMQLMAEYDLRIAQGQSGYLVSATAAVDQLNDARATLGLLREPDTYVRTVANTLTAAKYRHKGLPLDTMRRGLRSHKTRIVNASDSMALPEDRTDLYSSQHHLVRHMEKLYIQLQRQVLGIKPPEPRGSQGRSS